MDNVPTEPSYTALWIGIGVFLLLIIGAGIIYAVLTDGNKGTTTTNNNNNNGGITCQGSTCTPTSGFSFVSEVDSSTLSSDINGNLLSTIDTTTYTPLVFVSISDGNPGDIYQVVSGPANTIGWILAGQAENGSLLRGALTIGPLSSYQGVKDQHYHWDFESNVIRSADQSNRAVGNLTTSVAYVVLSSRLGSTITRWKQISS